MSGKFKFDQNRTKTENLHEGLPKFMVTLVTEVNMAALTKVTSVSVAMVTLLSDVIMVVQLPRLPEWLSLLWLPWLLTSQLYYQGYQCFCRYGYLGY